MMKNVFKKISMMLVGAAFVLPSQAQLLKVTVKDKALQKQAMFINHGKTKLSNPPDEGDSKEAAAE